jgi:hypothetical protein
MGHELRTPLNAILGYSQLLLENKEELQSEQHHIDLAPGRVYGDGRKLQQVLVHLLDNAVKFTEAGGVTLSARVQADGRYYFAVADSGPSIAAERINAVFELFDQGIDGLQKGGTGLGLTISRQHVEMMGGQLVLKSELGQGTRVFFAIELSAVRGGAESVDELRGNARRLAPGYAVQALVVGSGANVDILTQLLQRSGAQVDRVAAEDTAPATLPDIAFVDGEDYPGDDAAALRHLAGERAKLVVLATSFIECQRYIQAGFDAALEMPLRPGRVYAEIARLLGVGYEYNEELQEVTDAGAHTEMVPVQLPRPLFERLEAAIKLHSVTELRKELTAVEALGEAEAQLAAKFRQLSQ